MPEISVVLPVYNGEKYLDQTIRSVLDQTFEDFELLIINDGSKDRTLDILQGIQDPRIKIFSYSNAGLAASRNRGIAQAAGDFIAFIDADDLWTRDKLDAQLQALRRYSVPAVAYSWTDYIDENSRYAASGSRITDMGNVYRKLLEMNFIESGSNLMVPRKAFFEVGDFDESLSIAEDWEMSVRLARQYHFVPVKSVQILYRMNSHAMTSKLNFLERGNLKTIDKVFSQVASSDLYIKEKLLINLYLYFIKQALVNLIGVHRGLRVSGRLWDITHNRLSWLVRPVILKIAFKILLILSWVKSVCTFQKEKTN